MAFNNKKTLLVAAGLAVLLTAGTLYQQQTQTPSPKAPEASTQVAAPTVSEEKKAEEAKPAEQEAKAAPEAQASESVPEFTDVRLFGRTMGTTYHINYPQAEVRDNISPVVVQEAIDQFLIDFNKEFSTYDPNSVISRFNKSTEVGVRFEISERFAEIVKESRRIYELTNGYEDVTVYPLVKAWGFGPGKAQPNLSPEQVDALKAKTGMDNFELIQENGKYYLVKNIPEISLDFSSIAKGFGVDLVADIIDGYGVKNYLVEIGGEVVAKGHNLSSNPWSVAIEQPNFDGQQMVHTVVEIKDLAMATSGNYRNFRLENGKRISHEIDPFTGYPIDHTTVSLTVLAKDCMAADGLATGLYVMGAEKALELAEQKDLAIFVILYDGEKFVSKKSSAFEKLATSIKEVEK